MPLPLNAKQLGVERRAKFVELVAEAMMKDRNGTGPEVDQAAYIAIARECGFWPRGLTVIVRKLLADAKIVDAIEKKIDRKINKPFGVPEVTAADVIRDWWLIHSTNVTDLIEYRRDCCRHCYGKDFKYHETPSEYRDRREAYDDAKKAYDFRNREKQLNRRPGTPKLKFPAFKAFDDRGGVGFTPNRHPHPNCPECHGHGVLTPYPQDTRKLTAGAKRLYSGVKVTNNGHVEVLLRNQDRALELLAKHLGMLIDRREQGKPGEFDHLTPEEQEERVVQELVRGGITEEAARAFVRARSG